MLSLIRGPVSVSTVPRSLRVARGQAAPPTAGPFVQFCHYFLFVASLSKTDLVPLLFLWNAIQKGFVAVLSRAFCGRRENKVPLVLCVPRVAGFFKGENCKGLISPALQTKLKGHLHACDIVFHVCVGHVLRWGLNPEAIFAIQCRSMSPPPCSMSMFLICVH